MLNKYRLLLQSVLHNATAINYESHLKWHLEGTMFAAEE